MRGLEVPLEARFARGLKQLRETLYFKGVTFNALFAQLQNGACVRAWRRRVLVR